MKRKYYFLPLLLVFLWGCKTEKQIYMFTSFKEPASEGLFFLYSDDGYNWKRTERSVITPQVGNQKVMRDPSIVSGSDGEFHLVWTSSWRGDLGFGYSHSNDLVNWSEQQFIPAMQFDTSTVNVWAPELFYDDENQQFIIIWASTIPFKFEKGIEEERNNHRMYYTTTKDFRTFSETKLFLDPGFSVIDAIIIKRKKDDYVLVLKDNTRPNRNLKAAFADNPLGPYHDISEPFTGKLTEGPTGLQIGNEWLIYYDAYGDKEYRAVKTADFKTFTNITDQITIPEEHKHGTIFTADESILNKLLQETGK